METVFAIIMKKLFRLLIEFIKCFRLYEVEKNYKFHSSKKHKTTTIKVQLNRKELPEVLKNIQLFCFGQSEILDCTIQCGKKSIKLDTNRLTKNKRELNVNHIIKHYGNEKITLIVKVSSSQYKQTLVLSFRQDKHNQIQPPKYIFLHNFETLQHAF